MNKTAKHVAVIGFFIAMQVILTRFLSIPTPLIRIDFGFLPIALCSMMFGPILGGISAAVGDILGVVLFPSGSFFIGFTITAFLTGVTFGFLQKTKVNILSVTVSVLFVCLILDTVLDSVWLYILYGNALFGMLPARIIKNIIMVPVEVASILFFWKAFICRYAKDF